MTGSNGHHHGQARDVGFERGFTLAAAAAAGRSATPIIQLAEQRAPLEPISGFLLGRDFGLDGMEEGADWRNYLCWHAMHIDHLGRRDPLARAAREALGRSLQHVVIGFEEHRLARELLLHPNRQAA